MGRDAEREGCARGVEGEECTGDGVRRMGDDGGESCSGDGGVDRRALPGEGGVR